MENRNLLLIFLVFAVLLAIPITGEEFTISAMIQFFIYFSAALMWGLLAEHAGLVSLGQQIFIGIGGYATAVLSMYYGIPVFVSVVLSSVIGGVIALALSLPLLRLRGFYFAIGSFLAAEIILLLFLNWEFIGAGKGLVFKDAYQIPITHVYYSTMVLCLASAWIMYRVYHSKLGFGLRAVGADELAASELGVNTLKVKTLTFVIAGILTSLAGGLNAVNHAYLHPRSAFSIDWTINFLFISVIGGIGTITGTAIGTAIFVGLGYLLSGYIGLSPLLQGIIALAILLSMPTGIRGVITKKLKLKDPL